MDQLSNPEEGRTLFIHDLLRSMKHHPYEKDKEGQSEGDFYRSGAYTGTK